MKLPILLLCLLGFLQLRAQHVSSDGTPLDETKLDAVLAKIDWRLLEHKSTEESVLYTVPVVVHVLHNYGTSMPEDSTIYNFIDRVNSYMLMHRPDTAAIIDKYKPIAASARIVFRLASRDPYGNATNGIEYLHIWDENLQNNYYKYHQWPTERYVNVWVFSDIASGGYSISSGFTPLSAEYYPYWDGIMISRSELAYYDAHNATGFASFLGLSNPCGIYACADNDGIPDTPPCDGAFSVYPCSNLYSAVCDTPNIQNIMLANRGCDIMFTRGQAMFMQQILSLDFGMRDSLVTPYSAALTGVNEPRPDVPPRVDYWVARWGALTDKFAPVGASVYFYQASRGDTVTNCSWTFSNGAINPTSTSTTNVANKFAEPGWMHMQLTVTGNNTGTVTRVEDHALYVADTVPVYGTEMYHEFASTSMGDWPMYNVFENDTKWMPWTSGYFDMSSVMFNGYAPQTPPVTLSRFGDYDVMYSAPYDLSHCNGRCYLQFMSSGAFWGNARYASDTLEISCVNSVGAVIAKLAPLVNEQIGNMGTVNGPYYPTSSSDWIPQSLTIPEVACIRPVYFRFRYKPGVDSMMGNVSNNFFMDHLKVSQWPLNVPDEHKSGTHIAVWPNPATTDVTLAITGWKLNTKAQVQVTDATGRVVYATETVVEHEVEAIRLLRLLFPAAGVYMLSVVGDDGLYRQKLVIE